MNKETISQKQAVSIVALFIVGSSLVFGTSKYSKQDAWIALLITVAVMMPVIYFYIRLMHRYPGKNIFDICIEVFGKIFGKVLIVLFVWYAFHLGSLVLRNFSEFIEITAFNQMPQTISLVCLIILVIWVVKRGVEVLGRWSSIVLPILVVILATTFLFLLKDMHITNLMPVGENLYMVPKDVLNNFAFPFGETVLFLGVLNTMKKADQPGKAWVYGIFVGGAMLLFGGFFRNALVLGFPLEADMDFPSYGAVSVIIAGSFISRIENVVGADLVLAGFVKSAFAYCLLQKGQHGF
jgi:spore germination protein KB